MIISIEFVVAGGVLLGLKPLALRARGFKPNKTLQHLNYSLIIHKHCGKSCQP
jgi:hypothetical protein